MASIQNMATALIQGEPWDFMGVYYDGIDQFGHEFMPYHPPKMDDVSERDFELYQDVMRGCYRFHDMMLHALLQYVDDQTTVILISDHGYECGRRRPPLELGKKDPEGCHRPFGVVCLKGPNVKQNERLYGASILDVTPTILTLLNLPIGCDMDGRPWLEAFQTPIKPERIFSWEGVGDERAGLLAGHHRQDPAEAARAIEQLVELGYIAPPSDDARKTVQETITCNKTNLVRALLGTPKKSQAIPILQEMVAANPGNQWAVLTLADCHISAGNVQEARSILESIPPAIQKLGQIQLLFAQLAFRENKTDLALSHLQAAVASEPGQPLLFNQLGWAFFRLRRWEDAERAFQKSLEVEGDNPAAFDGLASVHLRRDEPEKAVENSLQSVGLIHFYPEAHFRLGAGLQRLGKAPEAILAYETALGMGYRPGLLHLRLAELYRPLNAEKADFHQQAALRSRKQRIFQANVLSKLPTPKSSN
jgi:tetratricopeptide (TPR) repeat protein